MVNETGKVTGIPQGGEEENFDSYEKLLDQYGARKFAEGEVMKGTVLKITDTDVIVDIGYKSEGVIPVTQFVDPGGHLTIAVGDVIDVGHVHSVIDAAMRSQPAGRLTYAASCLDRTSLGSQRSTG